LKDLSDFPFFPEDRERFLLFDARRKLDEGRSMEREEEFNMLVVASFVLRDVLSLLLSLALLKTADDVFQRERK